MRIHYSYVLFVILAFFSYVTAEEQKDVRITPTVLAVKATLPSVVSIGTQNLVTVNDGYDTFFHEFYGRILRRREKVVSSYMPLGSGIIISSKGLIITNNHVVKRANNLEIRLWNGKSFNARIVGYDNSNDLAILQIIGDLPEEKLKEARFGQPDDVLLGETVITIGNPYGLDHSVSQGVLSALNRSYSGDDFDDILQTDAAINPGNSGGPLINLKGEVIGINQAIRRGASGIGFAIPAKRIEQFIAHWLLPSRFSNVTLGISGTDELQWNDGVVVGKPAEGTPAAQAGLKAGDVITHINGKKLTRLLDFSHEVWSLTKGDTIHITLSDGRKLDLTTMPIPHDALIRMRLGLQLQALTPELCEALDIPSTWRGLVITELEPEQDFTDQQAFWRTGLRRGDIVIKINDIIVQNQQELANQLRQYRSGDSVILNAIVFDDRQNHPVQVKIQAMLK